MAKRKARKTKKMSTKSSKGPKRTQKRASVKRPIKKRGTSRPRVQTKKRVQARKPVPTKKRVQTQKRVQRAAPQLLRLNRARRTLNDDEIVPGPPSSLDFDRRATSARSGRAEQEHAFNEHRTLSPSIAGGDVDVDLEDAYFTGDEAPGGDNSTPDQDIVDDIGRALGVEYQDDEELKAVDKVTERDRNRWELDPASSEDYKERK